MTTDSRVRSLVSLVFESTPPGGTPIAKISLLRALHSVPGESSERSRSEAPTRFERILSVWDDDATVTDLDLEENLHEILEELDEFSDPELDERVEVRVVTGVPLRPPPASVLAPGTVLAGWIVTDPDSAIASLKSAPSPKPEPAPALSVPPTFFGFIAAALALLAGC